MLSPSWSRSIGWEHIQLLFFFSQKPQVYGGYISGNGTDFLFICSILTCVVHLHFLCGWVAPRWYSLGCVEISDPPGSWCELKVWISVGILLTHHPGMSPGDGWDSQANLAPISSVFCMLHTLQALVSLLLTILPLLSLSGLVTLLCGERRAAATHGETLLLNHTGKHSRVNSNSGFLHNCQRCALVSTTATLLWEAFHPQFTPALNPSPCHSFAQPFGICSYQHL